MGESFRGGCYRGVSHRVIQNALNVMVNRYRIYQNAAGHSFPDVINDQSALNLADICLDNTLQILHKSLLCFVKFGRLTTEKSPKLDS